MQAMKQMWFYITLLLMQFYLFFLTTSNGKQTDFLFDDNIPGRFTRHIMPI